jgi:hypothetical protein
MNKNWFLVGLIAVVGCREHSEVGEGAPQAQTERGVSPGPQTGSGISGQSGLPPSPTLSREVEGAVDVQTQYGQVGTNVFTQTIPDRPGITPEEGPVNPAPLVHAQQPTPEDVALAQRVHVVVSVGTTGTTGILAANLLNNDIAVTSSGGVITLTGVAPSQDSAERVVRLAESIEGVERVVNRLRVAPEEVRSHSNWVIHAGVPSGLQDKR